MTQKLWKLASTPDAQLQELLRNNTSRLKIVIERKKNMILRCNESHLKLTEYSSQKQLSSSKRVDAIRANYRQHLTAQHDDFQRRLNFAILWRKTCEETAKKTFSDRSDMKIRKLHTVCQLRLQGTDAFEREYFNRTYL